MVLLVWLLVDHLQHDIGLLFLFMMARMTINSHLRKMQTCTPLYESSRQLQHHISLLLRLLWRWNLHYSNRLGLLYATVVVLASKTDLTLIVVSRKGGKFWERRWPTPIKIDDLTTAEILIASSTILIIIIIHDNHQRYNRQSQFGLRPHSNM